MADFWETPNPFSVEDLARKVRDKLAATPDANLRDRILDVWDRNQAAIHSMIQTKLDNEHKMVLRALARELALDGVDVGPEPGGGPDLRENARRHAAFY
jgi:hypothetical protein